MLPYLYSGIALGSIYAIAASGIMVTYVSTGVLNFAFGAMAFFLARFYYFLNSSHGWPALPSLIVSVFLAGPALGAFLYFMLFQHLRLATTLIKIVATIGISVALPALALIIFGDQAIPSAPGLSTVPVATYSLFGAVVTLDQLLTFGCVVGVVIIGTAILQFTDVGLKIRGLVDSEAMTSLSGVSPSRLALGVWMGTTALAGLAGVLAAPTQALTAIGMTALMASAFAAVVAAQLKSLPVAVTVAMLMGILTDVIQKYLDSSNSITPGILASIPAFVMGGFLLIFVAISGRVSEASSTGGALDHAIRPQGGLAMGAPPASTRGGSRGLWSPRGMAPIVVVGVVALLPLLLSGYWMTLLLSGLAFGVIFLSFTMVVGEGGMIWLCMATFAGGGAVAAAQLATNHGFNPLLAMVVGALMVVPVGLIIGFLTIRLGNLYVALVTLTFGLLADSLIFTRNIFSQDGIGVAIYPPNWLYGHDIRFSYFILAVFIVLALGIVNLRRSTTGLALAAARVSEPGARTVGLGILGLKLVVAGIATFIAAIGGALLAMDYGSAGPTSYATFAGLVWLAVFVTMGLRSITAALVAGLVFSLLPGVFSTYLPTSFGNVATVLFGLGAVACAKNPEGQMAVIGGQLEALGNRLFRHRGSGGSGDSSAQPARGKAAAGPAGVEGLVETTR
jgi:branched-chain amino acid transport system permease protein